MTAEEMVDNLGTIAHSGAREFLKAVQESGKSASDLIGQFGVGFYSAFMVAEWIRVTSRSYRKDAQAATWYCTGADTFTVEPSRESRRGTTVVIQLKEDAKEFAQENRLREIIRKHSDFIPFPIYVGDEQEQANRQTALWRQQPREVEQKDYDEFYQQLTLDFEPPLAHAHMVVDAPVQMYALLFIPAKAERGMFWAAQRGWAEAVRPQGADPGIQPRPAARIPVVRAGRGRFGRHPAERLARVGPVEPGDGAAEEAGHLQSDRYPC